MVMASLSSWKAGVCTICINVLFPHLVCNNMNNMRRSCVNIWWTRYLCVQIPNVRVSHCRLSTNKQIMLSLDRVCQKPKVTSNHPFETTTVEFFLNRAELSLNSANLVNSANSGNLINR